MTKPLLATSPVLAEGNNIIELGEREGITIDKGVTLTAPYLESIEDLLRDYGSLFSAYPDLYLDLITPSDSSFELFFTRELYCARS